MTSPSVSPISVVTTSFRRCTAAGATFVAIALAALSSAALAQEVGPPVVEYRERGIGTFEVRNTTLFPMNVVMEPFGFVQDSVGRISYVPFDTSVIKLRLSAMSMRVPPRSALTVSYEVSSGALPAWFVITSTFAGVRRQGVNYNFQLPHVVYLHQKASVRKEEVELTDVALDTAAKVVRFRIRNTSLGMTRCKHGTLSVTGGGSKTPKAPVAAFPLFPGFARWMAVEWTHAVAPTKLHLSCTGVELDFDRLNVAIGGGAPTNATGSR